jgi:hypothetical protein
MAGDKVAIDVLIAILEEDGLAAIAALGHVMRQSRNDDASDAHMFARLCRLFMAGQAASGSNLSMIVVTGAMA